MEREGHTAPVEPTDRPPPSATDDLTPISALTKMRVEPWRAALSVGGDRSYAALFPVKAADILRTIEHGATVDFAGDRAATRCGRNHPIDPGDRPKVAAVIAADVAENKKACLGRHAPGATPLVRGSPLCILSIGAVPKKNSTKVRVIHDLSFPKGGDSINGGIDDGSLDISSFGHAARAVVELGRGCFLIKLDVEAAYKQVPVRPEDWHLLGFEFDGQLYYERVLPFGLRSSCRLWELFAAALHFLCEKLPCKVRFRVVHYVDDFLFVVEPVSGPPPDAAAAALMRGATALCEQLGVPMATGPGKVEGPTTCLVFLGLELDTVALEVRLSAGRLSELLQLIVEWQSRERATIKEMQSLTGLLNFAGACVLPTRVYTRRLINWTTRMSSLKRPDGRPAVGRHAPCRLTPAVKADIAWWAEFLPAWNGKSLLYERDWQEAPRIELFTDACESGFGGYFQGRWTAGAWRPEEQACAQRATKVSMPFYELRALVIAAATWGHLWARKKITFRSDCMAAVSAIEERRSRTDTQMHQIRTLDSIAARCGFDYRAIHVAGALNDVADVLSRHGDCQQFRALRPQAARHCCSPANPALPTASDL